MRLSADILYHLYEWLTHWIQLNCKKRASAPFSDRETLSHLGSPTAGFRVWSPGDSSRIFGNGLYRLSEVEPTELETIAMVAAAIPNAVMCLLTALRFHKIGTQSPHEVWIALDRKARKPAHPPSRVRIVRFSGAMLTYGVVCHSALDVPFRITSPARTVVDCFRYRNKFGLDIALEALHDGLQSRTVRRWMRSCAPPKPAVHADGYAGLLGGTAAMTHVENVET